MERTRERIDFLEAEEKRHFAGAEVRVREESSCRLTTNVVENVLIRCAQLTEASLYRPRAHAERFRQVRPMANGLHIEAPPLQAVEQVEGIGTTSDMAFPVERFAWEDR